MASALAPGGGVLAMLPATGRRTLTLLRCPRAPPRSSDGVSFLSSQLCGLQISMPTPRPLFPTPTSPATVVAPVAKRVCPFTGKKANRANKVSFSNHKTKKLQFVNLQYKRVWWEAGKRYVKLRLSTKALKTIEKNGLDAVAKKAGIDLRKE
ncbi:hypothetical protein MLD38_039546 [Melastoma candidum]|uniref:Uncharacterized protein n=1 Tax=Melastoma candidum TaxID=119954 RepID=A0ACB9L2E0_9MYRT|nr:hypothetical protein MLD38_039546 [Melastoma candidum]